MEILPRKPPLAPAAFTLQISNTVDLSNINLSFKAQMLSVQTRSTTWVFQYALGASPTSFTDFGTYMDPGTFGSTAETFGSSTFTTLENQNQNVWIRVVAPSISTGGGNRDTFGIDDFSLTYTRAAVAPDYWDVNGSVAGIGGSGTWDTVVANKPWNPNAAGDGQPINYDPTHLAVFGGTAGTVTVAGTVTTNRGLQFDSTGYVLNSGTITLAGVIPTISVTNAAETATVNSVLAGTVGLTKDGPGTLVLGGTNTYTGGTTINGGTIAISSDANLGATSSGITFATGKLRTTSNLTLVSTRALTGAGAIDVAAGTTLQIDGSVTGLDLTLSNTGSLLLTNATPTLAGLTLQQAASVTTTATTLGIVGNLVTQYPTGAVTLGNVDFGSVAAAVRQIVVADGTAPVDLLISGNVTMAGLNSRLAKTGSGTLELAGTANSIVGGIRLGEAGLIPVDGGTLRIASPTALGGGVFQANAGALVLLSNMTGANAPAAGVGISIGASDTSPVTISGGDIDFKGPSSIFINGSTAYQNKLIVNSNVTLSGPFSGTSLSLGLTIAGTGSLTIASASNTFANAITVSGSTLVLNGSFTATNKPTTNLQNAAILRGAGITGNIVAGEIGSATIAPGTLTGQATGVITGNTLDLRNTATLSLDIRSTATVSSVLQYDQLVAATDLFIDSTTLVGSIASGASIAVGDLFFIAINGGPNGTLGSFAGLAENGTTTFTGPGGSVIFQIGYHGDSATSTFDASTNATPGNDVVLKALVAVPEPGSASFLAGGIVGLVCLARLRRTSRRPRAAR